MGNSENWKRWGLRLEKIGKELKRYSDKKERDSLLDSVSLALGDLLEIPDKEGGLAETGLARSVRERRAIEMGPANSGRIKIDNPGSGLCSSAPAESGLDIRLPENPVGVRDIGQTWKSPFPLEIITGIAEDHDSTAGRMISMLQDDIVAKGLDIALLQDVLKKNIKGIATHIYHIALSTSMRDSVLHLRDGHAEVFLDLLQNVLDYQRHIDMTTLLPGPSDQMDCRTFTARARNLLRKLATESNKLPSSLFVTGIDRHSMDPSRCGGFADLFEGSYKGARVALKRMRLFTAKSTSRLKAMRKMFCREVLVWRQLDHPSILPFIGIYAEEQSEQLYMVLPWMQNGNAREYMQDQDSSISKFVNRILYEVADGLSYLHFEDIVHGDLRGGNILIDDSLHARICDLGLATFMDVVSHTTSTYTGMEGAGSIRWMAPELFRIGQYDIVEQSNVQRSAESDIYSFGCVCVELYTNEVPFPEVRFDALIPAAVKRGARPARPSEQLHQQSMSDDLWELVLKCFSAQTDARPSAEYIASCLSTICP